MDSLLEQVRGKIFFYCDSSTSKMVRCVCHSCALDIDVFTGLSVVIDDRLPESLEFAKSVKMNEMSIRSLRFFEKELIKNGNDLKTCWMYKSVQFSTVHHVSLLGYVHWKWLEESLVKFSNLTSILISGSILDTPIFPYNKKDFLIFLNLKFLEIYSMWAKSNILHPKERRYIFSDSTEEDDEDEEQEVKIMKNKGSSNKGNNVDIEKEASKSYKKYTFSTPVADNIYQLLSLILAPKLLHFRLSYDEDLYNIGYLNWKDIPLKEFLKRHSSTLQQLILDGNQNDMDCFQISKNDLKYIPINLKFLFLSIVDVKRTIKKISNYPWTYLKNVIFKTSSSDTLSNNLWKHILDKQYHLEAVNCTIYADWGWSILEKTMTQNCQFLQVINIGVNWPDVSVPMNMDIIGQCIFLRRLSFNSMTEDVDKRCRLIHLSSLISCPLLESVFITSALCETDDLDVFGNLPSLTSLVLMYVGKMANYGVSVGILEDFLHIRTLYLLIVVEFYRQKHSLHSHRLKKILTSSINTSNCPIISSMVPYTSGGKFVYVGNIDELSKDSLPQAPF